MQFYIRENYLETKTKGKVIRLQLKQISTSELTRLRESKKPGFVLKKDHNYYYADISQFKKYHIIVETNTSHKCANCRLLSAASDKDGGCAKVREFSRFIENFEQITYGYETFNTSFDVFIVLKCNRWKIANHTHTTITKAQIVLLAQYLWEHVDTFSDVREMMKREKV